MVSTFARHLKEAIAFSIRLLINWKLPATHPSPRIDKLCRARNQDTLPMAITLEPNLYTSAFSFSKISHFSECGMARRINKSSVDMPYRTLDTLRGTQLTLILTPLLLSYSRISHLLLITIV